MWAIEFRTFGVVGTLKWRFPAYRIVGSHYDRQQKAPSRIVPHKISPRIRARRAVAIVAAAMSLWAVGIDRPEIRASGEEPKVEPTFDGRSLEEWKRLSVSDLSQPTRVKAMQAFVAFGQAGRTEMAVAAIKHALEQPQVDTVVRAGYNALVRLEPTGDSLLLDALKSQQLQHRRIAAKELGWYSQSKEPSKRGSRGYRRGVDPGD